MTSALWSVLATPGDGLLLLDWQDGSRRERTYIPVGDAERFERLVAYHHREGHDLKIGLCPRRDRHLDNLAPGQCLWASVENPVGARSLQAFRPSPTLLFRRGRRQIGLWWLTRPLPMRSDPLEDWLTRANKRLAYALKANSRHANPEWLMPLWDLEHADPSALYEPVRVVGRLRDAPVRLLPSRAA